MTDRQRSHASRFGSEMRRMRMRTGKTQGDIAEAVKLSKPMISALERGTRAPKADVVDALDDALSTGGALQRLLRELQDSRDVPAWFRDALLLERRAQEIREYQPMLIPGLLQTYEYTRTMIGARHSRQTTDQLDHVAKARTERLPAITGGQPLLWFVIREVALAQVVGDESSMRDQLGHVAKLADEGTVRVQVLPGMKTNAGLCETFRVSALSNTQSVAYVEHALGGETFESPDRVSELSTLFGFLSAESLSPSASIDFIRKKQGEY